MKKILSLMTAALCCLALAVSCNDDETGDFNFYGFNPNPAVRGEKLYLYGEGMGSVTGVTFAGGATVTDVAFDGKAVSLTVPMDARPGVLTLLVGQGSYTTRTALTFEEKIAPDAQLAAYTDYANKTLGVAAVGEKLYIVTTAQTDYLSDIERVEFAGEEAEVEFDLDAFVAAGGYEADTEEKLLALSANLDFVRSGHLIVVTVPQSAKSGNVVLYDSNDDRYVVGAVTVAQSVVADIAPATGIIPGVTRLTIRGGNFGLVTGVVFAGGVSVAMDEAGSDGAPAVTVNPEGTLMTVMTKRGMQDGPIALQTASGEVIATPAVETAMPQRFDISVAGGRYKAGETISVACTDTDDDATNYQLLSQIEKLSFGETEAAFAFDDARRVLTAAIPAEAVDGALTAVACSGKSVTLGALTFVKATLEDALLSTTIELEAGNPVQLQGADLDLVTAARIGDRECAFTLADGVLEIATERGMRSGKLSLTQANGLAVDTGADGIEVHFLAVGQIVVTSVPASSAPGMEMTIEGANFNMVEAIRVGTAKVTLYTERSDNRLSFIVPMDAPAGSWPLTFQLTDGTTEETAQLITFGGVAQVETTVFEGPVVLPAGWGNAARLDGNGGFDISRFAGCTTETLFTVYLADHADNPQIQIKDANWAELVSANDPASGWNGVNLAPDQTTYSFKLDAGDLEKVRSGGMIIGGQNVTIVKVTVTESKVVAPSAEKTIFETPTVLPAGWGNAVRLDANGGFDISCFAECTAETLFTVYLADHADNPQIQIKDANWAELVSANDPASGWNGVNLVPGQESYSFKLDAGDLEKVRSGGMIIGGQNVTITRITIQ